MVYGTTKSTRLRPILKVSGDSEARNRAELNISALPLATLIHVLEGGNPPPKAHGSVEFTLFETRQNNSAWISTQLIPSSHNKVLMLRKRR